MLTLDQDRAPQDPRFDTADAVTDQLDDDREAVENALAAGDYETVADALDSLSNHASAGAQALRETIA